MTCSGRVRPNLLVLLSNCSMLCHVGLCMLSMSLIVVSANVGNFVPLGGMNRLRVLLPQCRPIVSWFRTRSCTHYPRTSLFALRISGPARNPVPRILHTPINAPVSLRSWPGHHSHDHLYVVASPSSCYPSVHTHSLRRPALVYTLAIPQCSLWLMLHATSSIVPSPPSI